MTTRHHASLALRLLAGDHCDMLSMVLDTQLEAVAVLDAEGHQVDVNTTLCSLLGYEPEQLLGKSPVGIYWPRELEQGYQKIFKSPLVPSSYRLSKSLVRSDGERVLVVGEMTRNQPSPLNRHLYVFRFRLTANATREARALCESEERYRFLCEYSPYGIFVHSGGVIRYVNEEGVKMWGGSHDELISRSLLTLVHPEFRDEVMARMVAMLGKSENTPPLREKLIRKDGSTMHAEVKASPIAWDGKSAVQLVVRDITEERDRETRLAQAERLESIGNLTASVAHDFNNLLTVVLSSCALAARRCPDHKLLQSDLKAAQIAAERGGALTRQLLAFGHKPEGSARVSNLGEVVSEISLLLDKLLGEKIRWRLESDADLWISKIRPLQVEQVLMNLASNSKTAMPRGGSLTISLRNITVDDSPQFSRAASAGAKPGRYVEMIFCDTGTGMNEETRMRVFEKSFTTGADSGGSGLGLATVFSILKENGGAIIAESELEKGTCFKAYFPSYFPAAEGLGSYAILTPPVPIEQLDSKETILIIEDQAEVRQSTRAILEVQGYRVVEASGGAQARVILASMIDDISLILSDVMLEDGSGPDIVEEALLVRPEIPVLYMTGFTKEEVLADRKLSRDAPVIDKPFTPSVLCSRIYRLLASKRS